MSSDDRVSIRMLGGFEIRRGEHVIIDGRWNRRKAAALIKLLALQPRRTMHREQVLAALWPDKDTESGANNLHKAAHYLRSVLARASVEADLIVLDRGAVILAPEAEVDIDAFAECAQRALRTGTDALLLQRALDLYRGALLPDDLYEEWAEPHRERLAQQARRVRLALTRVYADGGRTEDAIDLIAPVVADDPALEDAQIELIRAYSRRGDQQGARRRYANLTDALRELDLTPSFRIDDLIDETPATLEELTPPMPPIQHALTTDGVHIAFQMIGGGSGLPLVVMPMIPWSHLEVEWSMPEWRRCIELLARDRPVIRYDGRALGLSQRGVVDVSLAAQVRDLAAVSDALKLARIDLVTTANSFVQGAMYALDHPERVRRIVAWCPWADGASYGAALDAGGMLQLARTDYALFIAALGAAAVGSRFTHLAARHMNWMGHTALDVYISLLSTAMETDITPSLVKLEQPVLGLTPAHAPIMAGLMHFTRTAIAALPNARLAMLEDQEYHLIAGDHEALASTVEAFLDAPDGREFDDVPGLEPLLAADAAG